MKTINASLLAAGLALGLSAGAIANEDEWTPDQPEFHAQPEQTYDAEATAEVSFDELDVNNDGYVHQSDIPPEHELATLFAQYDIDGDGRLSRAEFELYAGEDDPDSEPAE